MTEGGRGGLADGVVGGVGNLNVTSFSAGDI